MNNITVNGVTPCISASIYGHIDSVRLLLTHFDIDINLATMCDWHTVKSGSTALSVANLFKHLEIAQILVATGAEDVSHEETGSHVPSDGIKKE